MNHSAPRRVAARTYLACSTKMPFAWADRGEAIVSRSGSTILFRKELAELLRGFDSLGGPSLATIVLVAGYLRGVWSQKAGQGELLMHVARSRGDSEMHSWILRLHRGLQNLADLAPDAATTIDAKRAVFELLFEDQPRAYTAETLREAAALLEAEASFLGEGSRPESDWARKMHDDLSSMAETLPRVTVERIRNRRETGFDDLPVPAEEDVLALPDAAAMRTRLQEWKRDPELAGISATAGQLLGAVQLPRSLTTPDSLPLGGVSDITNRGAFDRLLISELAQDDDTLLMRVAMNEALYFRRETPPQPPSANRAVLVDTGLRMWGVRRLFATSVLLALAATARDGTRTRWYSSGEPEPQPIDLSSREGLVQHLGRLSTPGHPGASLDWLSAQEPTGGEPEEGVLIIHRDSLAMPAFQSALSASRFDPLFGFVLDRDGSLELMRWTAAGAKTIRKARLDPEALTRSPRPAADLVKRRDASTDLAIDRLATFPLRLTPKVSLRSSAMSAAENLYTFTPEGELYRWSASDQRRDALRAHRRIATDLRPGRLYWMDPLSRGIARMVVGQLHRPDTPLSLLLVRPKGGTSERNVEEIPLRFPNKLAAPPLLITGHAGRLFVVERTRVHVFSYADGAHLHEVALPYRSRFRLPNRFFRWQGQWFALSHGGFETPGEPVFADAPGKRIHQVFDCPPLTQPVGMTRAGRFFLSDGEPLSKLSLFKGKGPYAIARVSPDGRYAIVIGDNEPFPRVIDFESLSIEGGHRQTPRQMLEERIFPWTRDLLPPLHDWFDRILFSPRGAKRFGTPWGTAFTLERVDDDLLWSGGLAASGGEAILAGREPGDSGNRSITIDNERRVLLDPRGLVHLVRGEVTLTLVMTHGRRAIAGWKSDRGVFGDAAYRAAPAVVDVEEIWTWYRDFLSGHPTA